MLSSGHGSGHGSPSARRLRIQADAKAAARAVMRAADVRVRMLRLCTMLGRTRCPARLLVVPCERQLPAAEDARLSKGSGRLAPRRVPAAAKKRDSPPALPVVVQATALRIGAANA